MKKLFYICFSSLVILSVSCKESTSKEVYTQEQQKLLINKNNIERIEPPYWWIGFQNKKLQLLVKHEDISDYTPSISFDGISIENVSKGDNSNNYLFIDLKISESASAGKFNIVFKNDSGEELIAFYELKERQKSAEDYLGFNSSDAIYLITPDRFANANSENDSFESLNEQGNDRTDGYARHGGDIQGITQHLDYIKNLGFTAIWPTPVLINDMPNGSYHGYAMTDYYKVDPRFGTLDEYKTLAEELAERDMKLIMDQVANHCGLEHWWMKDLPFTDWINYQSYYEANSTNCNSQSVKVSSHRRTTNQDTYASEIDKQEMTDGWFVAGMPDLNQRNPFMANYIIQNSIWWIETLGL